MPFLRHHPLADPVYVPEDLPVHDSIPRPPEDHSVVGLLILLGFVVLLILFGPEVFAQARLPGSDASDKLEAAGTLLRLIDTGLFSWGSRIFAGICIMSSAWALKEQRFGIAIICVVGAVIFGTAPTWVKNIFAIGGSSSVFGYVEPTVEPCENENPSSGGLGYA